MRAKKDKQLSSNLINFVACPIEQKTALPTNCDHKKYDHRRSMTLNWMMNQTLLVVLIIAIATFFNTAHISAYPNDCSGADGFYPNPSQCTKFFRCVTGTRYDFDCAPGTHFNPLISVCDWPNSAGCQSSTSDEQIGVEITPTLEPQFGYKSQMRNYPQYPEPYSPVYGASNEYSLYQQYARPTQPPIDGYIAIGEYRQPNYEQITTKTYSRKPVEEITQGPEAETGFEKEEVKPRKTLTSYVVYEKKADIKKPQKATTTRPPTKSVVIKSTSTKGRPNKSGRLITAEDENQDNSILTQPKPIESKKKTEKNEKNENPLKTLPKCETNHETSTPICTLDNFDWLSIADTEIISPPTKLYRLQTSPAVAGDNMNDTMKQEVLRQVARQCEHYCNTLLQSRASNYSISCVGYTYTAQSCRLFSHVELEIDWLPRLLDQVVTNETLLTSLKPSPGSVSRIQLPRKELVDQKWLLTETEVPTDYFEYLKGNNEHYKEVKGKEDRPVTLSDCLKACQKKGNKKCRQFVFSSFEGKCYLRREKKDKDKEDMNEVDNNNEGWEDNQRGKKSQNKVLVADVISGENVEPAPVARRDKKDKEDEKKPNMDWYFYEETNPQMLNIMQDLILNSKSQGLINSIKNVSNPHKCREVCLATWQNEDADQKCHFIAVREEATQQGKNKVSY